MLHVNYQVGLNLYELRTKETEGAVRETEISRGTSEFCDCFRDRLRNNMFA